MATTTVSRGIYDKFLQAISDDKRIPPEVVERIKQLLLAGKLSDPQSVSAILAQVERTWRASNH